MNTDNDNGQNNFYQSGEKILVVNDRNLLRFEHLREKPEIPDRNEDPGAWEEEFNGQIGEREKIAKSQIAVSIV